MQVRRSRWVISGLVVVFSAQLGFSQTPTIMTREQAAQIALRFAQVGQYPGTLHWLTTDSLPAKQEVPEWDHDLITYLAAQGDNWNVTMKEGSISWFDHKGVYSDSYVFLVTFDQFPGKLGVATVNAWTGYCVLETFRTEETNTDLGLSDYPVKTVEEMQNIALNVGRQLLGEGTYKVFAAPADGSLATQQDIVDFGWRFVVFKMDPQTGAHLPQMVDVVINSRTGWLEEGRFWNRPVTVNTKPLISEDEAKNLAAQYLTDAGQTVTGWLEGYYGDSDVVYNTALPYNAVTGLFVIEDELLEQSLQWLLIYTYMDERSGQTQCGLVMVDAHTGAVLPGYTAALHSIILQRQKRNWGKFRSFEGFLLLLNGRLVHLQLPMVWVNGRMYIRAQYADNLGAQWDGNKLKGRKGEVRIGAGERLYRSGRLYLPLRRICEVSGIRLWWDNKRKVPILRAEWLEAKKILAQRQR